MSAAFWELADGSIATLLTPGLSGVVDVARPASGLTQLSFDGAAPPQATIAAIHPATIAAVEIGRAPSADEPIAECYVRGRDLVVTYAQSADRPWRTQVYWRAVDDDIAGQRAVGVDLQVSVQTSLLDLRPHVRTVTRLPAGELLHVGQSTATPLAGSDWTTIDPPTCVVARLPGRDSSYVEMVHPADLGRMTVRLADPRDTTPRRATLASELFYDALEKGVILRARVRGLFVPRKGDVDAARCAYEQFLELAPPLTT